MRKVSMISSQANGEMFDQGAVLDVMFPGLHPQEEKG